MGLDMWAGKRTVADNGTEIVEDIEYWRKHHDLHGAMRGIYTAKGGMGEFNGDEVILDLDDLDELDDMIRSGKLPPTTGFFFGNNPPNDESNSKDLNFIENARQAIAEGYQVYYNSSW